MPEENNINLNREYNRSHIKEGPIIEGDIAPGSQEGHAAMVIKDVHHQPGTGMQINIEGVAAQEGHAAMVTKDVHHQPGAHINEIHMGSPEQVVMS